MYLDQLDTVRFDAQHFNVEQNYLFAEVALMKNIIEGNKITLSQSQLFDSGVILKLLENTAFIKLFEKGIINVAMLESDLKKSGVNTFKDIIINKLRQGINDGNPYFYFSGIDSLSNKKLYSDNDKLNMDTPRIMAIEILSSKGKAISDYPPEHQQYFESLKNFADIIDVISKPITQKGFTAKKAKDSLSELIGSYLQKAESTKEYCERKYIKALRKIYDKLVSQKQADFRSAYYSLADECEICSPNDIDTIKTVVDFYYNFIVAESVSKSTDNLRELTFDRKILDDVDKNILLEVCKNRYAAKDEILYSDINFKEDEEIIDLGNGIENEIITWENINDLPNMPRNTAVRKACDSCIINLSTLFQKHHSVLCKAVPIVATGVGAAIFDQYINNPSEIYAMYQLIRELTNDTDRLLEEILSASKVNEAKARKIIYNVQERAMRIKGVK